MPLNVNRYGLRPSISFRTALSKVEWVVTLTVTEILKKMKKYSFDTLCALLKPKEIIGKSYFRRPGSFSFDSRTISPDQAYIALKGTIHDGHDFIPQSIEQGVKAVICSKLPETGSNKACYFLVKDTYQALKKICGFLVKNSSAVSFALTGSVGKTTTKEMLAFLLSSKGKVLKNEKTENNLLGVSKTVMRLEKDHDFLVTELGTNAPGEIKELASVVKPAVAVITGVKPVHIRGLASLSGIFAEKTDLLRCCRHTLAVLNRDDTFLRRLKCENPVYWFGTKKTADVYGQSLSLTEGQSCFKINGKWDLCLKTPACFFIYNALAAMAAAESIGISLEQSCKALSGFSGFPAMRMEKIIRKKTCFINDAYNSNPFAVKEALKAFDRFPHPKIVILGDMLELGGKSRFFHRALADELIKYGFSYVFTLGRETLATHQRLKEKKARHCRHFRDYREVLSFLHSIPGISDYCVFIKGSRALAMEKIIAEF